MRGIRVIRLGILLDNSERIELGSVSDSGGIAHARAGTIAQAIAKITDAVIEE